MNISILAFVAAVGATPVKAESCLGLDEARIQAGAHGYIVLPEAMRAARRQFPGEAVSANLCRVDGRLMYVLAIMARDGRVFRALVDPETAAVRQLP